MGTAAARSHRCRATGGAPVAGGLGAEYPDVIEISQDREAAVEEWERRRREAIAAGRQEADELLRSGDSQGAIAILDRLGAEYPDVIEISQDREAAVQEWERRRRAAIAAGRQEARRWRGAWGPSTLTSSRSAKTGRRP